jgi:signal transduction histidine kinase
MLIECPKCEKRNEVTKTNTSLELLCQCGEKLVVLPWLLYRRTITDQQHIKCPLCKRDYDLRKYRNNTEIACNCGSLLTVHRSDDSITEFIGRRKSDQAHRLLQIELQGLIDTSRLIHSSISNVNRLFPLIIQIATDILNAEGSTIVLRDKEEGGLIFKYLINVKDNFNLASFRLAEGEGIAGECVKNKSSIIVDNTQNDSRFSNRADQESGFTTNSILCVPLIIDNECIGALEVVNKKDDAVFDKHDLLLAEAIASQIAIAIHNVQLAEEALKTERLAAIGQAVTGISHCVKNVLNGLEGGVFILKKAIKESEARISEQGLLMLERHQSRLKDLVLDMLTYSKEREPEYKSSNLNEITASVVELMQPKANEGKILLEFHPMQDLENIEIDPQGIYRCILNLVSNALDACEVENSTVDVSIKPFDSRQIAIEIKDNGCGMDEAALQSIFKLFYSTKGSKGTGFGLAVTQKIVKEHSGNIEVSSKPGEGTTFRICLPKERLKPA